MLKENWRSVSRIQRLTDNAIIILSFFLAYYGRSSLLFWDRYFGWSLPFEGPELAPMKDYFLILVVSILTYNLTLNILGAYNSMRLSSSLQIFRVAIMSSLIVFFSLAATLFLLKLNLSRSFIILFCTLVAVSLTAERYVVLSVLRFWRRRGKNYRNIIICGFGDQALKLTREILLRPELGLRIRAFADLRPGVLEHDENHAHFKHRLKILAKESVTRRLLLGVETLSRALHDFAVDEVIFTEIVDVMPQVEEMVLICSEQGVRTTLAADLFSIGMVKSGISYFGGMPLIHFQTPPGDRWELTLKRAIDVVVSGMLLVLLAPVFLFIAIAVKLSSAGPVIFEQRRVGLNGRLFPLYKFRSMYHDAEKELEKLKEFNEMRGPVFKMKDDPRVTAVGRFLRRHSLDELPQLWNVFVGEMSLVGPRPPVPGEVTMYERKERRRLSMRPGITCTWQVSGRNDIDDFESWVKLDLEYIDNWSLASDFFLLIRTIPAVLFGSGAR